MKKFIKYLCGLCLLGVLCGTTTSCEDMLSPDSERHAYEVGKDTLYSYWGILKSLQNVAERYVILGECRGELVSGTAYVSDTIRAILNFDQANATDGSCRYLKASDYYHVINSCNAYLAMCDRERVTGTLQPYMLKEAAQVEAIRAWVYLQLVQVYKEVPFYTEPLLTTDDIDAFLISPETVTADNLIDKLETYLQDALKIELEYGFPDYQSYGYTRNVCHSSKAMIPLHLILGDLYLLKGDPQSCAQAANHYFSYLSRSNNQGRIVAGGALPAGYYAYGYKGEGMDRPVYLYNGSNSNDSSPWEETGAVSPTTESITAIPSSTNKLWGNVLRGVNEVFGYTSEISVRTEETSDTTSSTTASVVLFPQYDTKQLSASDAYFKLCKEQTFEIYIGASNSAFSLADYTLTPDSTVGDARQYWVRDVRQTYSNGLTNTEKFVTKQNPDGVFTTVYPMIYRKAMVWLRYAEALNRAGYPSYAFAILKNGLCNNDDWYPAAQATVGGTGNNDYAIKDSIWTFTASNGTDVLPADGEPTLATKAQLEAYLAAKVEAGVMTQDSIDGGSLSWTPVSYENFTDEACQAALYYLDRREVLNTPSYLNFKYEVLDGNMSSSIVFTRTSLTDRSMSISSVSRGTGADPITMGIHARGCGMPLYNDKSSSYDYVKKIQEKAKAYGFNLTKADIYSGNYDSVVKDCVEDLIVDEEALELAFEGTRFFDLMRVAHRRGDASYLANRLAKRDPSLQGKLMNENNWYFKLPSKK